MSIEHAPIRQKRRKRTAPSLPRIAYSIKEWCHITGFSKPTVYRQMKSGDLRYVEVGGIRRIPAEEKQRLGLETISFGHLREA